MSKPIQLRFAQPGIVEGPILLDARLAEHTTLEDLRAGMMRSRLVAEEMPDPEPAKKAAPKKAAPKKKADEE